MLCNALLRRKVNYRANWLFILSFAFFMGVTAWIYTSNNLYNRCKTNPGNSVSICSPKANQRGYHQRIVAYSLYGELIQDMQGVFQILVNTSRTFPFKYPGWVIRIYHDYARGTVSRDILNKQFGESSEFANHVDLCYVSGLAGAVPNQEFFGMTWRFLPLLDEQVDIVAVRDADSFIYQREVDAIREWLDSNLTFHAMRDHRYHCIPMLGGMWGVKLHQQREKIREVALALFSREHFKYKYFDQELLQKVVWPLAKESLMAHDSYCCNTFRPPQGSASILKPFPNQRIGNQFVGQIGLGGVPFECPLECRPQNLLASCDFRCE